MNSYHIIESPSNRRVRELLNIRDGKKHEDIWLIEGLKIVEAALRSEKQVDAVFITEDVLAQNRTIINSIANRKTQITLISERVAKKLSDTLTPQGVFATVRYHYRTLNDLLPSGIIPVIDRIQDPGNLGTIIRTADAFGMKSMILLEGTCSPANQKVIRSSASSVLNIAIVKTSEKDLFTWATDNKVRILVSDAGAQTPIKDIAPGKRSAIIFGNESSGVSEYLKYNAHLHFNIPIFGKAESLNVAVAASIILYEFSKKIKNP